MKDKLSLDIDIYIIDFSVVNMVIYTFGKVGNQSAGSSSWQTTLPWFTVNFGT